MMEGPFDIADPNLPNLDVQEIWDHIREMDAHVFFEMCINLSDSEKTCRSTLLQWLRIEHPVMFTTLEDIVRSFQSCYSCGQEARKAYMLHYDRWKLSLITANLAQITMETAMEATALQEEAKAHQKNKETPNEDIVQQAKKLKTAAQAVQKSGSTQLKTLFYAQERYTANFPFRQYKHFAKKGKHRYTSEELATADSWQTIYFCSGPWNAEMLAEEIEREKGCRAIVLKKTRGVDADVMGFKVLEGAAPVIH